LDKEEFLEAPDLVLDLLYTVVEEIQEAKVMVGKVGEDLLFMLVVEILLLQVVEEEAVGILLERMEVPVED
jgi:hypothetical protein